MTKPFVKPPLATLPRRFLRHYRAWRADPMRGDLLWLVLFGIALSAMAIIGGIVLSHAIGP